MAKARLGERKSAAQADATAVAALLCIPAGIAALVGLGSWMGMCTEGNFDRCRDGDASFEVWFQAIVGVAGFAATLAMAYLFDRARTRLAVLALVVAVLLFATWWVFLDAAVHGWDGIELLGLAK